MNNAKSPDILVVGDPVDLVTSDLGSSFSIAASAGCGKTHILIARVISLIKKGIGIERLLLLTFTENAAREMRTRLAKELLKYDESWAESALEQLPYASVQTIHSFAFEIISSNFLKAGLSSQPSIADDINFASSSRKLFSNKYNDWANSNSHYLYFVVSHALGISRTRMFDMVKPLQIFIEISDNDSQQDQEILGVKLNSLISKLEKDCRPLTEKILKGMENQDLTQMKKGEHNRMMVIKELCDASSKTKSPEEFFVQFYGHASKMTDPRLSVESRSEYVQIEDSFDIIREHIQNTVPEIIDTTISYAVSLLWNFIVDYRIERFDEGIISHDETLTLAASLLEKDSVRFDVWKKYTSILVDEFQDTDDTQIRLIEALAEKDSDSQIGRLFVVGDSKQSIYGFRGAQVDSYENFVETSDLTQVPLDKSYRSSNLVLEPVNKIMLELLPSYREMQTDRRQELPNAQLNDRVAVIGTQTSGTVDQIRRKRALDVASSIGHYVGRTIENREGETISTYSDIAILMRNSTGVNDVIEALQSKSIPYSVDSVDLIWEVTFTKMSLALMLAISDPSDSISIVGALKSPFFGCDNDDLIKYVDECSKLPIKRNSIWNYEENTRKLDTKVSVALVELSRLHRDYVSALPSTLLTELHNKSGFIDDFTSLGTSNAESISRFLLSLAVRFEESYQDRSLKDFMQYLNAIQESGKSPITYHPSNGDVGVSLMTIHKSKGLEFPIVYVMPSIKPSNNSDIFAFDTHGSTKRTPDQIKMHINSKISSADTSELLELKKEQISIEESRLLYVAMTRARDFLIFCLHEEEKTSKSNEPPKGGVAMLRNAIEKSGIIEQLKPIELNLDSNSSPVDPIVVSKNDLITFESIEELQKSILIQKTISPSSLGANIEETEEKIEIPFFKKITRPNRSNLIGNAVHRALNIIAFDAQKEEIELISKKCALREGISELSHTVSDLVSKALAVEIITKSTNHLREVPISGIISGRLVEGYIDLIIETESGWIIIDYKTDAIESKSALRSKVEKYENQLKTYAYLVSKSANLKVHGAAFLFLRAQNDGLVFVEDIFEFDEKRFES